jgi:hypothetical protein
MRWQRQASARLRLRREGIAWNVPFFREAIGYCSLP